LHRLRNLPSTPSQYSNLHGASTGEGGRAMMVLDGCYNGVAQEIFDFA
jgi:hypothetical protein